MSPHASASPSEEPGGRAVNVLYIDRDERVRSGRLVTGLRGGVLTTRDGRPLAPRDVLAVLAPPKPTTEQRAACDRASAAGYRVETV